MKLVKCKLFYQVLFILLFLMGGRSALGASNNSNNMGIDSAFSVKSNNWGIKLMGGHIGYYELLDPTSSSIESVVGQVISAILMFLGVIFIILIVYGGFLWMMAGGNEQEVGKAQKIIKNAVIGLLVVALSYGLSWLVLNLFVDSGSSIPKK